MEDNRAILRGEEPSADSVNTVDDVPDNFKMWLEENAERAATHYTMPYFVRDNQKYIPKEFAASYGARLPYETLAEYEAAMRYNRNNSGFSEEIKKNIRELNEVMPVVQGKVMNFTEADGGRPNPNYDPSGDGYSMNCGTCVPAYLLRRRGFDVEAGEYKNGSGEVYSLRNNVLKAWKHPDGILFKVTDPEITTYGSWAGGRKGNQSVSLRSFLHDNADEEGIYMVYLKWQGGEAHVTVLERDKGGNYIYYDPQNGKKNWLSKWEDLVDLPGCWIMRIDDKLVNEDYAAAFVKAR